MKVLITGANGFLGTHIVQRYQDEHEVYRFGRGNGNEFTGDIVSSIVPFGETFDLVIHCAGKAHSLPKNKLEEDEFFKVNHIGTINLLKALTVNKPKQLVFISTVAVYGMETGDLISESHLLQGQTAYAKSKILAEQEVLSWGDENGVKVLILRLPLIAGVNPPGNLGKMIKGISSGKYLSIAGGRAKRSVVLAEDVAEFLIGNSDGEGIYNLTDGYHPSFRELEIVIAKQLNRKIPISISEGVAELIGKLGDWIPKSPVNSNMIHKMSHDLTFDDQKARNELGWAPRKVVDHFKV